MYQCEKCKRDFDEAERWIEERVGDSCLYSYHCPYCKSEDFGEAKECSKCGQEYSENELACGICPECQKKIDVKVREFFKDMTDEEIDYVFEYFTDIMKGW